MYAIRSYYASYEPVGESKIEKDAFRIVTEFYREYLAVAVLIGAALALVGLMLGVGKLIRPVRPQADKYITYEAGSDPVGGWGQSNVRYYVYALLFVIFDVEAVFIFPWAVGLEPLGRITSYNVCYTKLLREK